MPAFSADRRYLMAGGFFANYYDAGGSNNDGVFGTYSQWCDDSKALGFNSIGLAVPWSGIQPASADAYEWSWLDRYLDYAVNTAGLYPIVILDETSVSAPGWLDTTNFAQRGPDGSVVTSHGPYPSLTLLSDDLDAIVTALYTATAQHVISRYGVEKIVGFQNVTWPNMESTYSADLHLTDYSDFAQVAFRSWIQGQYASIGELNRVWGTQETSFADIQLGTETSAKAVDVRKFRMWALARHLRLEYDTVKAVDPQLGFFIRSGGLDDWLDDEHGEKATLMAASFCDIIAEDNEYFRPFGATISPPVPPADRPNDQGLRGSQAADVNYFRTGARIRGCGWDMEMDYLDGTNANLPPVQMNLEYRDNGFAGYDSGAQMINLCHWERNIDPSLADPTLWSFLPTLAVAAALPKVTYTPDKALYHSYWGGLASKESDLRTTFSTATLDGDRHFPLDVLAVTQYLDQDFTSVAVEGFYRGYSRGIWVPDGRVLSAPERTVLLQAHAEGIILELSDPEGIGTLDEYGHPTRPLLDELIEADAKKIYNASIGFTRSPGPGGWSFEYGAGPRGRRMTHRGPTGVWSASPALAQVWVGPHRQGSTGSTAEGSIRVWHSPAAGTVSIVGSAELVDKASPAAGIDVQIFHGSTQIFAATGTGRIAGNNPFVTHELTLDVQRNDTISFWTRSVSGEGETDWNPELRYV